MSTLQLHAHSCGLLVARLGVCAMITAAARAANARDHRTALPPDPVGRYKAGRGQARLRPGAEGDDVEVSIGGVVRAGVKLEHLLL